MILGISNGIQQLLIGWKMIRFLLEINYSERFVQRQVEKVQQQTAAEDQPGEVNRASCQSIEMFTLCHREQQEKNIKQLITEVFMWLYSALSVIFSYNLLDQKKIINLIYYLSSFINLHLKNNFSTVFCKNTVLSDG